MKKILKLDIINFLTILYLEILFRLVIFKNIDLIFLLGIVIYSLIISNLITLLTVLFKEKVNKIINYIIYGILGVLFSLQSIFKLFYKTFFSISLLKLTDQVVGFSNMAVKVIFSNIIYIILFFLPLILQIIFRKKIKNYIKNKMLIILVVVMLIFPPIVYYFFINMQKGENLSVYDLYYKVDNNELNIEKLGVLSSFNLDLYRSVFGFKASVIEVNYEEKEEKEIVYQPNILNLNINDKLNSNIRSYIENNPGTKQNEYTNFFKDKNLIFIVAESYDEIAVREDLTPTLYKLTHTGFVFNNFYVPYYLSTIGGEFQAITGLYPNNTILKTWRSGANDFKYGLANVFRNAGYNTYAYHDHSGYFQDRYKYLKALGFDNFKACKMGLKINCNIWPESDAELIEATYQDYINSDKPFMTYYMTVSGHLEYTYSGNVMVKRNWDLVKDLNYSAKAKSYLATQIELDKALESLIKKLEENDKLKDTVIVMLADHYPYGLSISEANELSSYERDETFEINHNSLILWNSELETKEIDKVGMPMDVIPTVYNLFGIKYDSRLFAGNDLFSTTEGLVILNNGSWITNSGKYNSVKNYFDGDADEEYIQNINNLVQNKINFSKGVLTYNAYKYIEENTEENIQEDNQ